MIVSSHRSSSRHSRRRHEHDDRRSRSVERYNRTRRTRRSRSNSSDRYPDGSISRSPHRGRSGYKNSSSYGARIRVDSPEPSRCLGVFGLSVYTTEPYLKDIFGQYGAVEKVFVIYDSKTRLSRGFGFVYFRTLEEASCARAHCNGMEFHGRRIRVDFSITEQPHPPTPGVYKGRKEDSRSPGPGYRDYSRDERHRHRRHRSES